MKDQTIDPRVVTLRKPTVAMPCCRIMRIGQRLLRLFVGSLAIVLVCLTSGLGEGGSPGMSFEETKNLARDLRAWMRR